MAVKQNRNIIHHFSSLSCKYLKPLCFFNTSNLYQFFILIFSITVFFSCTTSNNKLPLGSKETTDSTFATARKIMETSNVLVINKVVDSTFYSIKNKTLYDNIAYFNIKSFSNEITNNVNEQLLYADSGIALIDKANLSKILPIELAKFLSRRGDANFKLKNYTASYDDLFKAFQIAKTYSDNCGIMNVAYSISMILYNQQQYKSSANYFIESLKYLDNCSDDYLGVKYKKQEILDNIGLCYFKLNNYDSAFYYFKKAIDFIDIEKNNLAKNTQASLQRYATAKGVILGNMAKLLVQNNMLDSAVILYKQAINYHQKGGRDFKDEQICRAQLVAVYYKLKQPQNMWQNLEILQTTLPTINDKILEMEFHKLMYNYYLLENNAVEALSYLNNYIKKRDLIETNKDKLLQPDIEKEFKNKEQQYKIDSLEQYNKLNRIYLYVVAICAVLAFVLIFLIYKNYLKTKKVNASLTVLNEQINHQKEALQIANSEKDKILHIVAHDLRNPIGAILGFMNLLIAKNKLEESELKIITAVKKAANQSLELINDLLVANNPTETIIQIKPSNLLLQSLIETSIEQVAFKTNLKQQEIQFKQENNTNTYVYVDGDKIIRVFTNILDNAIKFSNKKAIITVQTKHKQNFIEITIIDEGIGLPTTTLNTSNNILNYERRIGTSGEKSVGIGLTICKQIIQAHGGELFLNANAVKGTTVTVLLPVSTTFEQT